MILVDTSGLWAALDTSQSQHEEAARALRDAEPPRLLSPFVLAELDYLLATRGAPGAALTLLEDVARGAYALPPFGQHDVGEARAVISRYRDQDIGLADASIVVLSKRHETCDLLTLDQRHFRALRGAKDEPFRLLPLDGAR